MPALDTAAGAAAAANSTSLTFSITVASNSNRALLVGVEYSNNTRTVSGITYNGVAMTAIDSVIATSTNMAMYRLVAPDTGAHDVVITLSGASARLVGNAMSYYDVDQSSPIRSSNKANASAGQPTVDITSQTGDVAVDIVGSYTSTLTVGTGQTLLVDTTDPLSPNLQMAGSSEAGATTTTMSWTGAGAEWGIIGVSLAAAAGGGGAKTLASMGVG